jgi:hypothetical protein
MLDSQTMICETRNTGLYTNARVRNLSLPMEFRHEGVTQPAMNGLDVIAGLAGEGNNDDGPDSAQ